MTTYHVGPGAQMHIRSTEEPVVQWSVEQRLVERRVVWPAPLAGVLAAALIEALIHLL